MDIEKIRQCCVRPGDSVHDAVRCMQRSGRASLVPVTDDDGRLLSLITDSNLRHAFLMSFDFDRAVGEFLEWRDGASVKKTLSAPAATAAGDLVGLLQQNNMTSLPLTDDNGCVSDLVMLDDLVGKDAPPMQAMIMAGGLGTRLLPLTEDTPKPMLKLNGRPVLEIIVEQLRAAGVRKVFIATHYRSKKISDHFGDGADFGVEIVYVHETSPLGTGGALGLLPEIPVPLLMINGDILTQVNFSSLLAYHQSHSAVVTVGVRKYDVNVPYGVIESHGALVRQINEKPRLHMFVNAGVYVLEPTVFEWVERGRRFDTPDLIKRVLDAGRTVVSFPIIEYWLDIGRMENYMQAQEDVLTWDERL